jgi:hypothetical protein
LFGAWIAAFDFGSRQAPYLTVFLSGPVLATLLLWYSRLLGRLAWKASGAPTARLQADDAPDQQGRPGRATASPKRKKRTIKIVIPDEIPGDEGRDDGPARPRLNFHR